tara:strand:+ start:531 stop:953 length:423 start_codon:yes stop_codon:yes gene_type:complete
MREWDQLSEKEQLLQYISDEYKRAYGVRPRGDFYNNRTVEQLRVDLDELNAYANEQYDLEKAREVERLEEFEERLFWIQEELGAENRMQALRWVVQDDEDAQYDPEYFMYLQGFSIYTNDAARNLLQDIATINKQLARAA